MKLPTPEERLCSCSTFEGAASIAREEAFLRKDLAIVRYEEEGDGLFKSSSWWVWVQTIALSRAVTVDDEDEEQSIVYSGDDDPEVRALWDELWSDADDHAVPMKKAGSTSIDRGEKCCG